MNVLHFLHFISHYLAIAGAVLLGFVMWVILTFLAFARFFHDSTEPGDDDEDQKR